MTHYQIIIAEERRTPVVTKERVYIGEYIDTWELDSDGDECLVQRQLTPDDPTSWEERERIDTSRLAEVIHTVVPTGRTITAGDISVPEYEPGPQQLHCQMATDLHRSVARVVGHVPFDMDFAEWDEEFGSGLTEDEAREFYAAGEPVFEYDILPPDFSDPQFVMVAEWDGTSPYVIEHKGSYADRTRAFAGWPSLTKEQYDALPADPVAA